MPDRGGVHFFLYEDCLIRVPTDDLVPKFGCLLLARNLPLRPGDVLLDLGAGAGLIGILAARRGHRVVATDAVPAYVECLRANALLNGVGKHLATRTGDLFEPVRGETFDVIAANPPQLPTPPDREWNDPRSGIDNGGPDGWLLLDRIIRECPSFLKPGGRLVFTLFGFLGVEQALERLRAAGLQPSIVARDDQSLPRLARERLEHIRSVSPDSTRLEGRPSTCERLVVCGHKE
ncbi:MAG: methyltransferase domain-containing protein [Zetaproteobacteria bacterium]|nr:MAG: methyltransferase domain-containing protein [Zetaproteobacteria bacterium]RPI09190.1 MAG: methyltransferase domain-containing protein [Zetaproteobacteria bacterium]